VSDRAETTALVDAWLDGRADDEALRRLEGLLAADPQCRRDFIRAMRFHHQVRGGLQFLGGVRAAGAPYPSGALPHNRHPVPMMP
jgi:hypothetical protein